MKKLLFLSLIIATTAVQSQSNNTVEVEEALNWMQGKMQTFVYSQNSNKSSKSSLDYTYELKYNATNCSVILTENGNSSKKDTKEKKIYKFLLSDIKNIDLEDHQLVIKTNNSHKLIKVAHSGSHNGVHKDEINTLNIRFTSLGDIEGQPERFIKAFTAATTMCGGMKKEKY
jgi:effector-binding domain-containing protein